MLADAKAQCDVLIIALQTDPTLDRPEKNKPIQTFKERKIMISSIKYVDEVLEYSTEAQLLELLTALQADVRILGSDWRGKEYTGYQLSTPIHWHERTHDWSTSSLRLRVWAAEEVRNLR